MSESNEKEPVPPTWERGAFTHAHLDCFSGAAGDMLLAACLDAADNDKSRLLEYISYCLSKGMPELEGEFSVTHERVWRSDGAIAATAINVHSIYDHKAAPVPTHQPSETISHDHKHAHNHSTVSSHSKGSDAASMDRHHDHQHAHAHSHNHVHNKNDDLNDEKDDHDYAHSHSHGSEHSHSHAHGSDPNEKLRNLPQIRAMLEASSEDYIPVWVQQQAIAAFTALAHAEAKTHGASSIDQVHFHEVGAIDSIVDTVGTLLALWCFGVETVSCSRLPLGEGTVWTAHGLLPVPAPATLRLLALGNLPVCPGPPGNTGELVTPTAAALLNVLVASNQALSSKKIPAGRAPPFTIRKVGVGAGSKNFAKHANILRIMFGDSITLA